MVGSTSRQWYKIICTDNERKQRRVEELRKEKQDQEMAECTFRPELVTRGSKKVNIACKAAAARNSVLNLVTHFLLSPSSHEPKQQCDDRDLRK
jgi:hypothetical protein